MSENPIESLPENREEYLLREFRALTGNDFSLLRYYIVEVLDDIRRDDLINTVERRNQASTEFKTWLLNWKKR